jgi:flagellar biosynthesis protein FliQ
MTPELAAELIKAMVLHAVLLAAPILLTAMIIGLSVSVFQAVTSIQEQSLTFVPKVLGVIIVLIILLPWTMRNLIEFTRAMIERIPDLVR